MVSSPKTCQRWFQHNICQKSPGGVSYPINGNGKAQRLVRGGVTLSIYPIGLDGSYGIGWRAWLIVNAGSNEWSHRRWQRVISALVVISAVATPPFWSRAKNDWWGSPEDVCCVRSSRGDKRTMHAVVLIRMTARKTNFLPGYFFFRRASQIAVRSTRLSKTSSIVSSSLSSRYWNVVFNMGSRWSNFRFLNRISRNLDNQDLY